VVHFGQQRYGNRTSPLIRMGFPVFARYRCPVEAFGRYTILKTQARHNFARGDDPSRFSSATSASESGAGGAACQPDPAL